MDNIIVRMIIVFPVLLIFIALFLNLVKMRFFRKHEQNEITIYDERDILNIVTKFQDEDFFTIIKSAELNKDFLVVKKRETYKVNPRKPDYKEKILEEIISICYLKKV